MFTSNRTDDLFHAISLNQYKLLTLKGPGCFQKAPQIPPEASYCSQNEVSLPITISPDPEAPVRITSIGTSFW